jgi:ribosomal-protein-alanine N-acetyltransferase
MSGFEVRLAERRDLEILMEIERTQFPEPWTQGMMLDELNRTDTRRYTVCVESGIVVGYLGVMFTDEGMHINSIGVVSGHERRGIARTLMDECWSDLAKRGVSRATLEVAVSNTPAIALYYSYGFAPVGIRKNYYQSTKEDALVLVAEFPSTMAEV